MINITNECKRVLKNDGKILLFGRGTSYFRWNLKLSDLGFIFKEEIIWDKKQSSSPVGNLMRVHESISIHSVNGSIMKSNFPYIEHRVFDYKNLMVDLNKICKTLNNPKQLQDVINFYENNILKKRKYIGKHSITQASNSTGGTIQYLAPFKAINDGFVEQSIIRVNREHYDTIHPTQKPIRLIERLLPIISNLGDIVLDPFSGSGSTAIACYNSGRNFIGCELDKDYYNQAMQRINNYIAQQKIF